MKNKTLQIFSEESLKNTKGMTPEQIIKFLEDFRSLHLKKEPVKSKLISIRIPEDLLNVFKVKSKINKISYQAKIKELMKEWAGP